jgi:hypothetical protein
MLPCTVFGQVTVRGIVTEQNSGNKPVPGVQIKALGSAPEASDNAGAFQLTFAVKKPGERIIVSEVAKAGYEIVNKDVLGNWLIPADPQARTKIVMCPEGTLARNVLKYYDLSQAALTRGYHEKLQRLQAQRDSARIDARTFGEQAKILADQFANQQQRLEELAERFARENFDDCSTVHRQAFEAFSQGRIDEALRILESVNSAEEIAKARAQKERGQRMERESRAMQSQSDSVIRQNIDKLLFQGDLYAASNRFDEADSAYATAAQADTTYFKGVNTYAEFLIRQRHLDRAARWMPIVLAAARSESDTCATIDNLAWLDRLQYRYGQAEQRMEEALAIFRRLAKADPQNYRSEVAAVLTHLANTRLQMRKYQEAEDNAREALAIQRESMAADPNTGGVLVARSLRSLALIHSSMGQLAEAVAELSEALTIYRTQSNVNTRSNRVELASALNELGCTQMNAAQPDYQSAERFLIENLEICRELAAANPDAYREKYAIALANLGQAQSLLQHDEASETSWKEAIAIFRVLSRDNPLSYNHPLATFLEGLCLFYFNRRQYEQAERVGSEVLAIRRELVAANPEVFTYFFTATLHVLASIYWADTKRDTADALNAECLTLMRTLVVQDSATYLPGLANMLQLIAWDQRAERISQAIAYTSEAIGIFQLLQARNANFSGSLSTCCRRMARYMILTRQFAEAETYARMDIGYGANQRKARKNLAHSFLYQGRYEEARAMYAELKDEAWDEKETYGGVFLDDLNEFERAGITHPDVAKIRALLTEK